MTTTKIKLSTILKDEQYAVKVTSIEQVKKIMPDYDNVADLEFFFQTDPKHKEYVGGKIDPVKGPFLGFIHPGGRIVIVFEDVEFDD